jgi:hypothetical protein
VQQINKNSFQRKEQSQERLLLVALALMAITGFLCVTLFLVAADVESPMMYPYLVPWITAATLVILAPLGYSFYKGKFTLFDPITWASWSYFLPVFIMGGIVFAIGLNQPYFVAFIDDPKTNLPLTYLYIILGTGGLALGYYLPFGRKIGGYVGKKLPGWDWTPESIVLPAIVLLIIGFWFQISAWVSGIIGFQRNFQFDAFDSVQYFLSLLVIEGSFLLWLYIFQTKNRNTIFFLILFLQIAIIPIRTMIAGSRGSLFQSFIIITMAYILSGKKLKPKQAVLFASTLVLVIFIGMIYGTTFRHVKGNENKVSAGEYVDNVFQTVDVISSKNVGEVFSEAASNLGERLENVSALAVIVSSYEKLAPYEAAYGMENNIWVYTWTAFIPRFIWEDKPIVSDARAFSDLYFNYADNSFPMTTIGDLLRNFGPVGIPLGMILLGFFLRILYAALIENQPPSMWRSMAYLMLLTRVSHEGFYGTILPEMIRAGFIVFLTVLLIKFIAKPR